MALSDNQKGPLHERKESKYLSKSTFCTICHSSGFNKAGKSFSEGSLWPLMSESSTQNQQFCSLGSVGWRQKLKQMKLNLILVASMSTKCYHTHVQYPVLASQHCVFSRPVGTTPCSTSPPDPEPFLSQLLWQPIHTVWPSFTKFSIRLGRTPKCHCFLQQYGNSLPWHMIKREIISFLLAGGNPDKYHSRFVSVCNRAMATVKSPYRGEKCGLSTCLL